MSPIPDLASARVGLLFLFAAMAPVIWIPKWGGGWFLYFLPAILVLISLLVSLHSERQVRAEERQAAREEEQRVAIAAVMAAKKDKHHHHTHNHSKVHSHEGSVASSQRKSQVGANTSSLGSNVSQPPGSRMNPVRFERIESERALPYEGIYVKGDEGPAADTFSEDWMKGEGLESKDAEAWLEVGQMGQEGGDEYRQ